MSKKREEMKKKNAPLIFSLVAAVLCIIGRIGILYEWDFRYGSSLEIESLLVDVANILPYLFLIIYLLFCKRRKMGILFSVVFLIKLITLGWETISYFVDIGWNFYTFWDAMDIIECIAYIGIIGNINSKTDEKFLSISLIFILLVFDVVYFIRMVCWNYWSMHVLYVYMIYVGSIFFYVSCMLHIIFTKKLSSNLKNSTISLEQMLINIKQQYEAGIITEQEYQDRKSSIISKL